MANEPTPSSGDARELNPAERGQRTNEVPMPEKKTGDIPPTPGTASSEEETQKGGRDTEESGQWKGRTR